MATSGETDSSSQVLDDVIVQFCAITGSDQMVAKQMLEACGGNLDMAIGMHMDSTGEPGVSGSVPSIPTEEDDGELGVRAPIPQKREVLVDETFTFAPGLLNASALLGGTPTVGLRGRRRPARSVFDGFRDFQAEARQQEMERAGVAGSSTSKRRTLEDLFRPPIDLMHKGSFHSARDAGTTESKWLMVNIQNVQEFQCQALNRDIWSHSAVKCIVREHFIFWQVYHDSEEGRKYVQFYPVKEWPYIAVLDPRTGENMVVWHQIDAASFCELVSSFLNEHPSLDGSSTSSPPIKKSKRSDSIVDASEDSQIEAAIAASLNEASHQPSKPDITYSDSDSDDGDDEDDLETFTDSESESPCVPNKTPQRVKKNQTPNSVASENSKSSKCTDRNNRSPLKEQSHLSQHASSVKAQEPENSCQVNSELDLNSKVATCQSNSQQKTVEDKQSSENSSVSDPSHKERDQEPSWNTYLGDEKDDCTKLMIRFPSGKKQQLSIPCSSQLKALTRYVIEEGYSADRYEIVTTFPKRKISQMKLTQTLLEVGLFPQETVFIQER